MKIHPLRLSPGEDLRSALERILPPGITAAFVLQGMGSLSVANLRFAGANEPTLISEDLELLTLSGSISPDGAHLHMSVADARGKVLGGHVAQGCIVRTTAELLLLLLPDHSFSREHDTKTGFDELVVRRNLVVDAGLSGAIGSTLIAVDPTDAMT